MRAHLPPSEWFPAGVAGISVRRVPVGDGVTLRVLEAGPADGPPILLAHGWAITAYLWRHNFLPLAAAGYRVIAPDLPGHGLSDAPTGPGAYTMAPFTRAMFGLMDALDVRRAPIIGQSMAGKVVVQMALDAPERVERLILFGPVGFGVIPPWHAFTPILPLLKGDFFAKRVPRGVVEFVQRRVYGKLGWFTERDVDEYWAPAQFPSVVRAQLQMLQEFPWEPWDEGTLRGLAVRTRVIFGTRDRTVRPVHAERLTRCLPHGALTWITDGGHVVMEEVPDRINAMLLAELAD